MAADLHVMGDGKINEIVCWAEVESVLSWMDGGPFKLRSRLHEVELGTQRIMHPGGFPTIAPHRVHHGAKVQSDSRRINTKGVGIIVGLGQGRGATKRPDERRRWSYT